MITGSTNSAFKLMFFLNDECMKILGGLLGDNGRDLCSSTIMPAIGSYLLPALNGYVWTQACHLVDNSCPVNPNPMCGDAV